MKYRYSKTNINRPTSYIMQLFACQEHDCLGINIIIECV